MKIIVFTWQKRNEKAKINEKKNPTESNADNLPLAAFQQTVPDSIPAFSNVKKDS